MNTFYDLTKEEKVVLTEEQVNYYAKLDCANQGLIIPQKPINELKLVAAPTHKYYQVGYESFVFETDKEAQDYIDAKGKAFQVKYIGNNYDNKNQFISEKVVDYKEIKSTILYTKEEDADLKSVLEYNAETEKEWKKYNESLKEFNSIVDSMWTEIGEIQFYNKRLEFYNKVYQDYVELAGGSNGVAYTFFDKAYRTANLSDVDREIVDSILNVESVIDCEAK